MAGLLHDDVPAVLAGDLNMVPTDFDIYSLRSFADNALVQPAPRAAFAKMIDMGWTDALRALHPTEPAFTFWSYLHNRWPRDAGLRLDHMLLSPALAPRLKAAGVDRDARSETYASDHAPVWIKLAAISSRTDRHFNLNANPFSIDLRSQRLEVRDAPCSKAGDWNENLIARPRPKRTRYPPRGSVFRCSAPRNQWP